MILKFFFFVICLLVSYVHNDISGCSGQIPHDKSSTSCSRFSDDEGYCCLVKAVNSPLEYNICQYFDKNTDIFSGFQIGNMRFHVDCREKQTISQSFPLHRFHNCGRVNPTEVKDCSYANIYPDDKGDPFSSCCYVTNSELPGKTYCLNLDFHPRVKQNVTIVEYDKETTFVCRVKSMLFSLFCTGFLLFLIY